MPFRPKIVVPDDGDWPDDADLNLSPDLELLAEQLGADAAMLAARYPAGRLENAASSERSSAAGPWGAQKPAWRAMWWSATAVAAASLLMVAVGWGGWRLSSWSGEDPVGAADRAAIEPVDGTVDLVDLKTSAATDEAEDAPPWARLDGAESLLINVSGPELEAVLDLLETQGAEDPFLSI